MYHSTSYLVEPINVYSPSSRRGLHDSGYTYVLVLVLNQTFPSASRSNACQVMDASNVGIITWCMGDKYIDVKYV